MRVFKELIIIVISAVALVYLFLPSVLPDFVPFIGWLDEGIATTILLSSLKHYGFDLTGLFGDNRVQAVPQNTHDKVMVTDNLVQSTQKIRIPRAVLEQALRDYQQQQSAK
ncbi:MAG: hypothetical protein AAF846_24475 [Chloroflexota bacterium]